MQADAVTLDDPPRVLGAGSMGSIVLAGQLTKEGTLVAIKKIGAGSDQASRAIKKISAGSDQARRARAESELRALQVPRCKVSPRAFGFSSPAYTLLANRPLQLHASPLCRY